MKDGSIHEIINHCQCVIPNTFRGNMLEVSSQVM